MFAQNERLELLEQRVKTLEEQQLKTMDKILQILEIIKAIIARVT